MAREGFTQRCYQWVRTIPKGRVATYADVAWGIGVPGAARAVGNAMRNNPEPGPTPCHRVVRSDGSVGHYKGGPQGTAEKAAWLRREGVDVDTDGRVQEFARVRFRGR